MLLWMILFLTVLHVNEGCTLMNDKQIVNITAQVGDEVLLTCSCSDLQTTPRDLKWRKKGKNEWESVPTNHSRFQLCNVQIPGNVSLHISHLTVEDDGLFRCEPERDVWTDFNLIVKGQGIIEQNNQGDQRFLIFIPVALLLLGLMGVVFWRYRAKNQAQTPGSKALAKQKNKEETLRKEPTTQDDIMYTTVVHTNTTSRSKVVSIEKGTEYAIIKLNE